MSKPWQLRALCLQVGWEPAFAGEAAEQREFADRVCRRCPVRVECRDFALAAEKGAQRSHRFGVFGGFLGSERAAICRGWSVECVDCCIEMVPAREGQVVCRVCARARRSAERLAYLQAMAALRGAA